MTNQNKRKQSKHPYKRMKATLMRRALGLVSYGVAKVIKAIIHTVVKKGGIL